MMLCGKILIYGSGTSTSGGAAAGAEQLVLASKFAYKKNPASDAAKQAVQDALKNRK